MDPPWPFSIIDGMATRPVFHTPVRFTPTTSSHCCSAEANPPGPMPALATTMRDRAEFTDAVIERLLQHIGIAHVGLVCLDAASECFDLSNGFVEVVARRHRIPDRLDLLADVDGDDVGALLRPTGRHGRGLALVLRR